MFNLKVTNHTCILVMSTVMLPPASVRAIKYWSLSSGASDIIQPDRIRSRAVCHLLRGQVSTGETKLTTHHVGVIHIPAIITHCSPLPTVINFNAAIVRPTTCQTDGGRSIRALHTGILRVAAIMDSPSTVPTVVDMWLATWTCHIVHPNGTGPLTMMGSSKELRNSREAELSAHYFSIIQIPQIIANCTPLVIV